MSEITYLIKFKRSMGQILLVQLEYKNDWKQSIWKHKLDFNIYWFYFFNIIKLLVIVVLATGGGVVSGNFIHYSCMLEITFLSKFKRNMGKTSLVQLEQTNDWKQSIWKQKPILNLVNQFHGFIFPPCLNMVILYHF